MTKSASSTTRRNGAQATNSSSRTSNMPTFRGRDVVFVDPLDDKESYWWPAMIVPIPEIDPSMDCTVLNPGECLVKYFEDNKYSVVKFTELQPFIPTTIPFLEFESNAGQKFLKSGGVINALAYLESGKVKRKFTWQYWGTAKDDELDLIHEKQKPLRLPLKKHEESSSSSSTTSNGHGKKGSTSGSTANSSPSTSSTTMTSGNKDAGPSSSPAAARKRTAKHSASQDLAGDADKALSPSRKRFSTPTALDTTATTTDTSSSASTPVTPDHPHFNHNHHGHHHGGTPGGVTLEKSSPTKTAPAGNSAGTTGHLRARNTSDHTATSAASVAASSQAQASTDDSMQQPQGHEQQNDHMQQQQQNTKGNRKRKSRTNSTPVSSAATSPSIPTAATLTDEPEEVKPEDYVSPASSAGTKRTRSSTTTTTIAASNASSSSTADTSSLSSAFPPPPPPTQSSSTASSPTQPVAKRRRGKSGATSNGNSHESQSSSTPSSRSGSRHGSIDEGSSPTAPPGRASRATKQNAANGQYQEMDEEAGIKSEMSSTHREQEAAENKNTDQTLIPSQSSQSLPDLGQNGPRKASNTTTTGGKKGKSTKHALSSEANGDHDGSAESEHDHDSSSSSSTPSDRAQHERKEEKQAKNGTQLPKDSQQMKMETDSDASSSVSSSPTLSTAFSVSVSSVSMELDAFSLERREMIHKMQAVLPTLPMGSKEREAMYESCMEHLQKLRKEHQRLRQILQMTGTTLDRRYGKGGRKSSPSLSVSSGRSYRSSRQQNGISKDYHERSSSPTVNGSRPSRAGTNKYYGRTR